MKELLPIVQSLFAKKIFIIGTYKYNFYKVGVDDDMFIFWVDTTLPTKGGSYLTEKLFGDCEKIILERMKYLSVSAAFKVGLTIDMEDFPGQGYISYELLQEMEDKLNKEAKNHYYPKYNLHFTSTFKMSKEFTYEILEGEVYFRYDVFLNNFILDDKSVKVKSNLLSTAFAWFSDFIHQNDNFIHELDRITYSVVEPEIQIKDTDIYTSPSLVLKKIDGHIISKEFREMMNYTDSVENLRDLFEPL